ncbi:hypothetical protein TWF281_011179 [Arthrobotrys megalospora]
MKISLVICINLIAVVPLVTSFAPIGPYNFRGGSDRPWGEKTGPGKNQTGGETVVDDPAQRGRLCTYRAPQRFPEIEDLIRQHAAELNTPQLSTEEVSEFVRGRKGLVGFEGCDNNQKAILVKTFQDARALFEPVQNDWKKYVIDWASPAAVEFFGPAADTMKYRETIRRNIGRVGSYFDTTDPKKATSVQCIHKCDEPDSLAYVVSYLDLPVEETRTINFCPHFFERNGEPSLKSLVDIIDKKIAEDMDKAITFTPYWTYSIAAVIVHEMFHLGDRSNPHEDHKEGKFVGDLKVKQPTRPEAGWEVGYGCGNARALASNLRGPYWLPSEPSSNADTYVCYLIAQFIQKKFRRYPYLPLLNVDTVRAENWPYRRSHGGYANAADRDPEGKRTSYAIQQEELAKEACKEALRPVKIEATSNTTDNANKKSFGWDFQPELCDSAMF